MARLRVDTLPTLSPATASAPADNVRGMEDRPPSDSYESLPERLIREAIEAGEFDELPGVGKPLPGAGVPDDDLWWVREWLKRNQAQSDRG